MQGPGNWGQKSAEKFDLNEPLKINKLFIKSTCCPGSNASTRMRSSFLRVFSNPSSNLITNLTPSSEMELIKPEENRENNGSGTISSLTIRKSEK